MLVGWRTGQSECFTKSKLPVLQINAYYQITAVLLGTETQAEPCPHDYSWWSVKEARSSSVSLFRCFLVLLWEETVSQIVLLLARNQRKHESRRSWKSSSSLRTCRTEVLEASNGAGPGLQETEQHQWPESSHLLLPIITTQRRLKWMLIVQTPPTEMWQTSVSQHRWHLYHNILQNIGREGGSSSVCANLCFFPP